MKILQICNFSSGISGVWTRVFEESKEFIKKGYKVYVFSSDKEETGNKVEIEEEIEGIKIKRFPVKQQKNNDLCYDFKKEAIELRPDIIICHGLRKPYLGPAIEVAKKLGIKCFLITHAPFIDKELRSKKLNFIIKLYDFFLGKKIMNSFNKVLAICKWEKDDLLRLGCDEERIVYLPNSLSEDFFTQPSSEEHKKILFLGRMHPVKEIEVLIEAFKKSNLKDYVLELVSSLEGEYYEKLLKLKEENIIFTGKISNLGEKIRKIDSGEIFVLPSRKESLPFGIIEAMSRGKIVVATETKGALELIQNRKNGFLFEIGDKEGLKLILNNIKEMPRNKKDQIKKESIITSKEFRTSKVMEKWEELFKDGRT